MLTVCLWCTSQTDMKILPNKNLPEFVTTLQVDNDREYVAEKGFEMPLAEIVFDFYDRLKTVSKGLCS